MTILSQLFTEEYFFYSDELIFFHREVQHYFIFPKVFLFPLQQFERTKIAQK